MSSREKIITKVIQNQPPQVTLPELHPLYSLADKTFNTESLINKYVEVLSSIGGVAYQVNSYDEVSAILSSNFTTGRVVSTIKQLFPKNYVELFDGNMVSLANVELAIIKGLFGVAENGAVWITEKLMGKRVLPFICQNLAVVLSADQIVLDMHHAYNMIGNEHYGYGAFIAGPSKTADIEQSLVLGAHGSRSMQVFLIKESM